MSEDVQTCLNMFLHSKQQQQENKPMGKTVNLFQWQSSSPMGVTTTTTSALNEFYKKKKRKKKKKLENKDVAICFI